LLKAIDKIRLDISSTLNKERRSELGQFMTPSSIADFMASLFELESNKPCRILDAGAGIGSLSCAFIEKYLKSDKSTQFELSAFEVDPVLSAQLEEIFSCYTSTFDLDLQVLHIDFIEWAAEQIYYRKDHTFTHAILNPPYKKISNTSTYRHLLREVGIETVNLYAAFIALALKLLSDKGQLVAIIPRSFCNGPYYKDFRSLVLISSAIHHIHLFDSRSKAFKDDRVLQENIIIFLQRGGIQKNVTISTSTDDSFSDYKATTHDFTQIVSPKDKEYFFHIPTSEDSGLIDFSPIYQTSLSDLYIEVSTGPVVDFRVQEYVTVEPEAGTVPLLYPGHFSGNKIDWPKYNWKKPNAILRNENTEKWLYPAGFYTVVRRFSSKEEVRRIHASVVNPTELSDFDAFGFENHFNVFHFRKRGISENIAYGLAVYLNSTLVDNYFRRFNGHTQVNATDLRMLKYPNIKKLSALGEWSKKHFDITQSMIDERLIELSI
jgi:adenine-specific DNA-methyltransferase